MNYREKILTKIKTSEDWPRFNNEDFLEELNTLADKFIKKEELEGYLASIFIYHQLIDELVLCLIKCSNFLIQCSIFPLEIERNEKEMEQMLLGKKLKQLKQGVLNKNIEKFIDKCQEFNNFRNNFAHELTAKTPLEFSKRKTKLPKEKFDGIYRLFEKIYDEYRVNFSSYKKNIGDL